MKDRLSIAFRHKQLFKDQDPLQPILVDCMGGVPTYIPGVVPVPDWIDMTEFTEGLDQFKLEWSAGQDTGGEGGNQDTNEIGSNYQKGLSVDLLFFDKAFKFIFDWLMTETCQLLNAVEVKITDNACERDFRIFELKLDNTKYAPEDEPCIVRMPLRELDSVIHSFQKTIIEDDWNGWFNKDGTSTKDHPTFSFIVEKKPKLFLAIPVMIIYLVGCLSAGLFLLFTDARKWIRKTLGFTYFCPSPLIRDYIKNICDKYGYTYDTIFDDLPGNPYRDLCFFFPGSRQYKDFENFTSPSTKFIWDNRTDLSFAKFLNQLKRVFKAEWYVTPNNKLVFKHKSYFDNQPPLYDFTAPGADKIFRLNYTFNGKKKAAYGDYQYQVDPQDTCSNELKWRYNAIVDYDGPADNTMLEGHVTKVFDFGMTSFHNDGSAEDFLEDGVKLARGIALGVLVVGLTALLIATGGLTAVLLCGALVLAGYTVTNDYINNFFDSDDLNGMVRLSSSEINVPRLLLWDRTTDLNKAKVVWVEDPAVNAYYNPTAITYYDEHPAHEAPAGFFGTTVTRIYNYPMYVEEMFTGNLFDRFHEYDNPLKNLEINQTFEGEVDLCCDALVRFGTFEPDFIKIGAVLVLEKRGTRLIKGRVEHIDVNYDKGRIDLNGVVLK